MRALTQRQKQILDRVNDFLTEKEIGKDLGISPETVKDHKRALAQKLGTAPRNGMLIKAARSAGYLSVLIAILNILPAPARIAPKQAPKRQTTELRVRTPKRIEFDQYFQQAAA